MSTRPTYKRVLADSYGIPRLWVIFTSLAVFAAVLVAALIGSSRYYGHITCNNWSEQTGRTAKFVILNPLDTGTCLTRTQDGRWVKNTDVREFSGSKP